MEKRGWLALVLTVVVLGTAVAALLSHRNVPDRHDFDSRERKPSQSLQPRQLRAKGARGGAETRVRTISVLDAVHLSPIGGAKIRLVDLDTGHESTTLTPEDGICHLPAAFASGGLVVGRASRKGYAAKTFAVSRARRDVRVLLRRGVTLRGTVIDSETRSPVRNYRISAISHGSTDGEYCDVPVPDRRGLGAAFLVDSAATVSSATGEFALSGLHEGSYWFLIQAAGRPPYEIGSDSIKLPRMDEEPLVVTLPKLAPVSVCVVDGKTGELVAGASFSGDMRVHGGVVRTPLKSEQKADGSYVIECYPVGLNGFEEVLVSVPGYAPCWVGSDEVLTSIEDTICVTRGTRLVGHVCDLQGRGIANAVVQIKGTRSFGLFRRQRTDASGGFTAGPYSPGEPLECEAFSEDTGMSLCSSTVHVVAGGEQKVVLGGPSMAVVHATFQRNGAPCQGAHLDLEGAMREVRTGVFRTSMVPGGSSILTAKLTLSNGSEVGIHHPVQVVAGRTNEVTVNANISVAGTVVDETSGEALKCGVDSTVFARCRDEGRRGEEVWTEICKDGSFRLLLATPGNYQVYCPEGGVDWRYHAAHPVTIEVQAGDTLEHVVLPLTRGAPGARIRVCAENAETGETIDKIRWSCDSRPETSGMSIEMTRGADGFTWGHWYPGHYRVRVKASQFVERTYGIEVKSDESEVEVTAHLHPSEAVRVLSVDPGTATAAAGLVAGDIILKCDGVQIRNYDEFEMCTANSEYLKDGGAARLVRLLIDRQGTLMEVDVRGAINGVLVKNCTRRE